MSYSQQRFGFVWGLGALVLAAMPSVAGCDPASGEASDETDAGGSGGGSETGRVPPWSLENGAGGGSSEERPPVDPCGGFATEVVDVQYGPGAGFGQSAMPDIVLGPPHGGGALTGSLDVVSLGQGGSITLGFGTQTIVDGEGPDFIVFENPFFPGGDEAHPFAEVGTVEVSADGATWVAYECTAIDYPYGSCAGWHPVLAGSDGAIDPHDPISAGGDAFDLAEAGLAEARFVRITDRPDMTAWGGAFDLDAVALVHFECAAK